MPYWTKKQDDLLALVFALCCCMDLVEAYYFFKYYLYYIFDIIFDIIFDTFHECFFSGYLLKKAFIFIF